MSLQRFPILGRLLSIAIFVGGIYLLKSWYDESHRLEVEIPAGEEPGSEKWKEHVLKAVHDGTGRRVFRFEPGWNRATAMLACGVALLAWASLGRWIGRGLRRLTPRSGASRPTSAANPKRESKKARRRKARRASTRAPRSGEDPV